MCFLSLLPSAGIIFGSVMLLPRNHCCIESNQKTKKPKTNVEFLFIYRKDLRRMVDVLDNVV